MNVIGLDFGTTNSILSFYNKTNGVESWKMGGSDGKNYMPSILTFDEVVYLLEEKQKAIKEQQRKVILKFKIFAMKKIKCFANSNIHPLVL